LTKPWRVPSCRTLALAPVVLLLAGFAFAKGDDTVQSATVDFPEIGTVRVAAIESVGALPRLVLVQRSNGRQLLARNVGTAEPGYPDFYLIHPGIGVAAPRLRFQVLRLHGLPDPLVVAAVMLPGGSDCHYEAVAIGAVKGQLAVLTGDPLRTLAEGGICIRGSRRGQTPMLLVWNFVWGHEGHYQPHHYEVSIFHFNATESQFRLFLHVVSKRTYATGEEFLAGMGLRCHNLLSSFPDFGC